LARFKYHALGNRCEPGKFFSVEITAHFRYDEPFPQAPDVGHPDPAVAGGGPHTYFLDHAKNKA
jgi:hypothetical protein